MILVAFLSKSAAWAQPAAELDAIAASHFARNEPGAAVLVMKDGETLLRRGYGLADVEQGIAIEPDMVFRIGSVTKQFTAAAILLLEEAGKLSVQDDLRKHLPDYPTHGRVITIEHLLTHTSGIRSYTDMPSFGENVRRDMSVDEVVALFKDEPLAFEPGKKYAYNNSGYFLLGAIIEKAGGKSYEAFLQEKIFEPLGMSQTYYGSATRIIPKRAQGYEMVNEEFQNASYLSMTIPYAAGSLLSTVDDLAKWDRALRKPGLLSRAFLEKWWKPFHLTNGESTHYGYGWGISDYDGHRVVSHGGGINGFTCQFLRMPDDGIVVAVLTNRNDEKVNPGLVARKLAAAALGKPVVEKTTVLAPEALSKRAGLYRTSTDARYLATLEGDHLFLRRYGDEHPDGGRTRNPGPNESLNRKARKLVPVNDAEFALEDSVTRVRFEGTNLSVEDWGRVERAEKSDEPFDDRSRVLVAVRQFFEGVNQKEERALRAVLDPEARMVRTETKGARMPPMSGEEFVERIVEHPGPQFRQEISDPEVRVAGSLATVWARYTFYAGNRLVHCGENAFQLAKTDVGWPGFRIIAVADTARTEGCEQK